MKHNGYEIEEEIEYYIDNETNLINQWAESDAELSYEEFYNNTDFDDIEDINYELDNYGIEPLPNNFPLDEDSIKRYFYDNYIKYLTEYHRSRELLRDHWDEAEEAYYDHMEEVYNEEFDNVCDVINDFIDKYDGLIHYDFQESRSWSAGRYPSCYFTFNRMKEDEDGYLEEDDEYPTFELRFSDGHNNGRMTHDYEIVFDEYTQKELNDILEDIAYELGFEN